MRIHTNMGLSSGKETFVEVLTLNGANINAESEDQSTPLHLAVLNGEF